MLRIPKCANFTLKNILASKTAKPQSFVEIKRDEIRVEHGGKDAGQLGLSIATREGLYESQVEKLVKVLELPRAIDPGRLIILKRFEDIPLLVIMPIPRSSSGFQHIQMSSGAFGGEECADRVLRFLGQPITVDGTTRWSIPTLKMITNSARPDTDVLLDMVTQRYAADPDMDGIDMGLRSVERLVALERFSIDQPYQDFDAAKVHLINKIWERESSNGIVLESGFIEMDFNLKTGT
ncbi:hypothetical protein FRB96_003429 [Tulasnella sp. 330]|nr:hypothetical protein FRB96_003429 [Tulasnella sp. 330]KAG8878022.1 hypothetical protein FRB98_006412 [Tulasnella sp. 332]KAG8882757.1 hypothetical protein FRB97_007796 [Tulasnella sp. 331]